MSRPAPPWLDDESALLLIDWSWWLNKAFRLFGLEGMTAAVVGWLTGHVLADRPAHVALCLDAAGETDRHAIPHPTDETWRYKGKRDPKPSEFYDLSDRLTQIAELHAIPILWARRKEADDVIATATAKARGAGYRIWICSADKDLCALVEADDRSGILVGTWDNFECVFRGPAEVKAKFGVAPSQIPDYLALAGDGVDAVPGVPGLGHVAAADILTHWATIEDALAAPAWPEEQYTICEGHCRALAKRLKITKDESLRQEIETERARIMTVKKLAKAHAKLHEHAALARFSRVLTALDCDVPIGMPWRDLPCGGFDGPELRRRLHDLGFTGKERQVPEYPKRAPWVIPYENDNDCAA